MGVECFVCRAKDEADASSGDRMSLADQLQNRHREATSTAGRDASDAAGPAIVEASAATATGHAATAADPASVNVNGDGVKHAATLVDASEQRAVNSTDGPAKTETSASSTTRPKQAFVVAELPQLRGSQSKSSLRDSPALSYSSATAVKSGDGISGTQKAGNGQSPKSVSSIHGSRLARQGGVMTTTTTLETPSDRKLVLETVQLIEKSAGVTIEIAKSATPGHATFMIKGPATAIETAKQQLYSGMQPRVEATTVVPSSARAALIGPRGTNLRRLEEAHHVKITLSAAKDASWSLDTTTVTVSGTEDAVDATVGDVTAIVDDSRQLSSSRRVPRNLVHFLARDKDFGPATKIDQHKITLQGPFSKLRSEMAAVDALLASWEATYVTQPLSLPELGSGNALSAGVLSPTIVADKYGVIVNEAGELYGPAERLSEAASAVEAYIASQTHTRLNIAQAHNRDAAHARVISRLLATRGDVDRVAARAGVKITGPDVSAEGVVYDLLGEEQATLVARKEIVQLVNALTPESVAVVRGMRHALVRERAAKQVAQLEGPVLGVIGPSDELFLVYEDPGDDFAPAAEEVSAKVAAAAAEFAPLANLADSLTRRTVQLEPATVKLLSKPSGPEATSLYNEVITQPEDVHLELNGNTAILSGSKEAVAQAASALPQIAQLSKHHLVRSSHVEEFQFDTKLVRNLIGRSGQQIQSLRDEFGVKIEVDENGHVQIQGIEAQVKAAQRAILDLQRRLRDETTERLEIPAMFHGKLIGPKGKHVKRLSEQHGCVIRVPPPSSRRQGSVESESSAADETVSGLSTDDTSPSGEPEEDVIIIRGPSRGVAAIKREFLDLVAYERAQSHSETISLPVEIVSRIVGRGGLKINAIRNETGANIDVGTRNGSTPAGETSANTSETQATPTGETVSIVVTGEQRKVAAAIAAIRKTADEQLDHTEKSVDVPTEYHRLLLGPQGATRRQLVEEAGGDPESAGRLLIVPSMQSKSTLVKLAGPSQVVDELEKRINDIVADARRQSQASGEFTLSSSLHRHIIGPGGQRKRDTEKKFGVFITIPRSEENSDIVTVRGESQDSVDRAIDHMRGLALPETIEVSVPAISWSQRVRRDVQNKFGARAETRAAPSTLQPSIPERSESNTVTVPVTEKVAVTVAAKTAESAAAAAEFIQSATAADHASYIWVSPAQIPRVIGHGGKTIKKIRHDTSAIVDVILQTRDEAVVLVAGPKSNVETASARVIEAVNGP